MWRKRKFWLIGLLIFSLATLGKQFYNAVDSLTHRGPHSARLDGKKNEFWIADFRIDPPKLKHKDKIFDFGKAWVEAKYERRNFLVWYSYTERADWDYLCVQPKIDLHQKRFWYELSSDFANPFSNEKGFGQVGDFFFQRVPTDVRSFKIKVTARKLHGKKVTLGIVQLVRN